MKKRKSPIHFVAVNDDPMILQAISSIIKAEGHKVTTFEDSKKAKSAIVDLNPDCIISDLMMPDVDGFQICKFARSQPELADTVFIVLTAKPYEFDVNRSYEFGAHGFIRKPLDTMTFFKKVERIFEDQIELGFWGVRGTLPSSGDDRLKYGGNTNCVAMQFPQDRLFIFDGGSGIKKLGDKLMANGRRNIKGRIFISHPHWDQINAIPFFGPLYRQGNEFQILGANRGDMSIREIISAQMDGVYFPITLKEFAARVYFRDLEEEEFELDGATVKTTLLSHPGKCLGFRIEYNGRVVCYITDNEMFFKESEFYNPRDEDQLADFVRGGRRADYRRDLYGREIRQQGYLGPFLRVQGGEPGRQGRGQNALPLTPRPRPKRRRNRRQAGNRSPAAQGTRQQDRMHRAEGRRLVQPLMSAACRRPAPAA
ncbi:MAG: response regulator [Rhodospirillaceae bacterium]